MLTVMSLNPSGDRLRDKLALRLRQIEWDSGIGKENRAAAETDTYLSGWIGRVEGQLAVIREQVREINEQIRHMSTRLDRLTFSLFAVGGTIVAGLIVLLVDRFAGG
jgi:hypothetical protein